MTTSDLRLPASGPRVAPLPATRADAYVRSAYDKATRTWGIPNNLIKTMGWLPRLALTEVDYANSFIFDTGPFADWPDPSGADPVLYPYAGFVTRVTKELVINLVSLLNRSRYSITHHTVIGYSTLCQQLSCASAADRALRAEEMLLHLVDALGQPSYEKRTGPDGSPLYSDVQLHCLRMAETLHRGAHEVTDEQFGELRAALRAEAKTRIASGALAGQPGTDREPYLEAYVNGMLVELIWCILHFDGLLNEWFTVFRVMDETDAERDGVDFVSHYNAVVPERIKVRNNNLLGHDGWGLER